jgi:hypothetical protein
MMSPLFKQHHMMHLPIFKQLTSGNALNGGTNSVLTIKSQGEYFEGDIVG